MKHVDSLLVLERGEELHKALDAYAKEAKLDSAWLSGLGGAGSVTLGFYDLPRERYQWKTFDSPLEIVSLTGNLSIVDGEPFWHIHGVFSGPDYKTIGGHVKELTVGPTCELHVTSLSVPLTRELDEDTGLKLIIPAK